VAGGLALLAARRGPTETGSAGGPLPGRRLRTILEAMKKPVVLVLLVAVAVVSVWSWNGADEPEAADSRLFADRLWVDHVPRSDKDTIQVFIAVTEHATGLFQASSAWRGAFELFRYEAIGGELRLLFPQSGEREAVRVKVRRCTEQGMDYCLDLDGATRGVKRYYSRKGWEIKGAGDLRAAQLQAETLRAELTAAH
jgi:hypothetical protein